MRPLSETWHIYRRQLLLRNEKFNLSLKQKTKRIHFAFHLFAKAYFSLHIWAPKAFKYTHATLRLAAWAQNLKHCGKAFFCLQCSKLLQTWLQLRFSENQWENMKSCLKLVEYCIFWNLEFVNSYHKGIISRINRWKQHLTDRLSGNKWIKKS